MHTLYALALPFLEHPVVFVVFWLRVHHSTFLAMA